MKKLTTLSLITATLLVVNGCGGEKSASTGTTEEVTSITKLSEVSQKHTKEEWNQLENKIKTLEKPEAFNTMLLGTIEKNIASLTYVGVDKEMAYALNSDELFDDIDMLVHQQDLDTDIAEECKDDESCKEEAYASLGTLLTLDKEEAYAIAEDYRGDKKALVNDKLVKKFTCEAGEIRTVKHYGIEDLFSTANGAEVAHPSTAILNTPWVQNYPFPVTGYDETLNDRIFADTLTNLPSNITKGMFYIGLKSNGSSLQSNDTLSIGDYASGKIMVNTHLTALAPQYNWNHQLVSNTNPTTDIYYKAFSGINMTQNGNSAGTLLDLVQNQNSMDVIVADDTSVDFITVATCSQPDPVIEISHIVDNFTCSEKEGSLVQVVGGTKDAFSATTDQASVASNDFLNRVNTSSRAEYDATHYDKHLLDTLTLPTGVVISKAEFNVGYKPLNSSLHTNDTIHIGKFGVAHSGGRYILYPNGTNPEEPMWHVNNIGGGEIIRTVDLNTITIGQTGDSVLNWMQGKSEFEVAIEDDTSVDFTQLNLCVKKGCDESAKDYKIDLSQLASWTVKPSDAQENNTNNPSVWASDMNWISFDNNGTDRVLEIPFCACGDTIATINHLKGDNRANIELDGNMFVNQPGTTGGVTAFSSDSAGGNHVDGTQTIAGTSANVNHLLRVNVHNFKSSTGSDTPFGVAIDGTLQFKGHLGKCE